MGNHCPTSTARSSGCLFQGDTQCPGSTSTPPVDSKVLRLVSRADQLRLLSQRNYGRWKLLTKGFVKADGPERAAWHEESAQECLRDSEWNQRHGPVPGGASVLPWRHEPDVGMPGEE